LLILKNFVNIFFIKISNISYKISLENGDWGLGIGDWGLGIGD
jgi:hypothetical protein